MLTTNMTNRQKADFYNDLHERAEKLFVIYTDRLSEFMTSRPWNLRYTSTLNAKYSDRRLRRISWQPSRTLTPGTAEASSLCLP